MASRAERMPLLDALRCIAALGIVGIHTLYQPAVAARQGEGLWRFAVHLDVAVPIFFVVSGFLLYRPFVAQRAGGRPISIRAYGWRRVFRIVPAYWIALTIITLWLGVRGVRQDPLRFYGFAQIYDGSTALQGLPQAWTLCVEVAFYALLPVWALTIRALSRRTGNGLLKAELVGLGGLVALAVLWNGIALTHSDPSTRAALDLLLPLPAQMDHLGLGMLLAVLSVWLAERKSDLPDPRRDAVRAALDRIPGGAWWGAAFVLWLFVCYVAGPDGSPNDRIDDVGYLLKHVLYGGVAAMLVAPAVFGDPRSGHIRRGMGLRPVLWIGTISYSVYLWHYAVMTEVFRRWGGVPHSTLGWVVWAAAIYSAVILVGAVSYYLVERPAMKIGRRLSSRVRGGDQPGAASVPVAPPPVEQVAADSAAARSS